MPAKRLSGARQELLRLRRPERDHPGVVDSKTWLEVALTERVCCDILLGLVDEGLERKSGGRLG